MLKYLLTLGFILNAACSGKPDRLSVLGSREGANAEKVIEPNDPGIPSKDTTPSYDLSFLDSRDNLRALAYRTLVNKLKVVTGLDEQSEALKNAAKFAQSLGNYDHAQGVLPDTSWNLDKMGTWMQVADSACRSESLSKKLQAPNGEKDFIEAAYGREFSPADLELLNELDGKGFAAVRRARVLCNSVLLSLEFVSENVLASALETYARQLAGTLAGRPLKKEERALLAEKGETALSDLLDLWMKESFFEKSFRANVETMIGTSGKRDGIDFNLPGNLAAYIVKEQLPVANLLTADYCINDKMEKISCDTGAPYAAGVMATRGYLVAHASRLNLGRASAIMNVFTCNHYPMADQPHMEKARLIENFRISSEEEAKAKGSTGFGNGSACYACHGQFAAHTQLFVKFDDKGVYKADATGVQDPKQEFGRSENGLYASHFEAKEESSKEFGNIFGKDVNNLAEAGKVISESPAFVKCMSKNAITHALGLDSEASGRIENDLLQEISSRIPGGQVKVSELYRRVLTHPLILKTFTKGAAE